MNGGQIIVDYLIQEKVPYLFGLCGHGNISFIDAFYERASEIKALSVHHESVSGFMADVYYRVSGQPVATFTSCGPGSANMPICLANSFLDSVPFLAVTGNVPTSQFNRGAFQETYRSYQADFPSTVRAYCKRVFQPTRADMVPLAVRQAWKTMVSGRPGSGGAGRPLRHLQGRDRAGDAAGGGVEREHHLPLRGRPRGAAPGGGHASWGRAAGDPGGPRGEVWKGDQGAARPRRAAADSRRLLLQRDGGHRFAASSGARASSRATAPTRRTTPPARRTSCWPWECASTTGPPAAGSRATRSISRPPSSSTWTSTRTRSRGTTPWPWG